MDSLSACGASDYDAFLLASGRYPELESLTELMGVLRVIGVEEGEGGGEEERDEVLAALTRKVITLAALFLQRQAFYDIKSQEASLYSVIMRLLHALLLLTCHVDVVSEDVASPFLVLCREISTTMYYIMKPDTSASVVVTLLPLTCLPIPSLLKAGAVWEEDSDSYHPQLGALFVSALDSFRHFIAMHDYIPHYILLHALREVIYSCDRKLVVAFADKVRYILQDRKSFHVLVFSFHLQ
jgi:hypothetical protein